jgi:hypothetical protein
MSSVYIIGLSIHNQICLLDRRDRQSYPRSLGVHQPGNALFSIDQIEQAGFIAPADPAQVPFSTDRPSRVFALTLAGRERFYQLMMDTTSNQGPYQRLFRIKALHLEYVSPEDQLSLVDHYVSYCQMGLRYQKAEAQDFVTSPIKQRSVSSSYSPVARDLMDLVIRQWQLELLHVTCTLARQHHTAEFLAFQRRNTKEWPLCLNIHKYGLVF